jgi:hypothetical protein
MNPVPLVGTFHKRHYANKAPAKYATLKVKIKLVETKMDRGRGQLTPDQ